MRKLKTPDHYVVYLDDDSELWVRADYDQGEDQWFDARAGVGSPGYPASVELTEVSFDRGSTWAAPDKYPQLNIEALEQSVMDQIDALWDAEDAALEASYEAAADRINEDDWK